MSWRFCALDGDLNVEIPEGQTTVGRGSLLQIADKHVSRSHAIVQLKDGKCSILPTHTNPSFHKLRDSETFAPLQQDVWQELNDGDAIGLAPSHHRFRLEKCDASGEKQPTVAADADTSETNEQQKESEKQTDETNANAETREEAAAAAADEDCNPAKKARVEVEKIASEEGLVPVLSSTAGLAASGQEQNENDGDDEEEEAEAKPRAPCQYGASCYRKNPIHFKEFSHPGDPDYITPIVPAQPLKPQAQQRPRQQPKTESGRPMRKAAARRVKANVLAGDSDEDEESFDENDTFNDDSEFIESSESEEEEEVRGRDSDDEWMPDDEEEDDDVKDLVIESDEYVPGGRRSRQRARRY
ncbi:aprataxin and PNK-like factor [Corticium candelabrum]|uniref:aprataxin and PNK-like factor n=1 Tax=Corticium candelabrum TaxID=121492 RepID=UPI002E2557D0|nr:aprataxin and PNK-like factor [Corticium candelabrum]